MIHLVAALIWFVVMGAAVSAQDESALQRYANLQFPTLPATATNDWDAVRMGWEDRVALEFEIVNHADIAELRAGLKDEDRFVRSMAARALGIRGDRGSADILARLARNDPEYVVRIRAVESLGLLKMKPDVIDAVQNDKHAGVSWAAELAADQLHSDVDCAAQIRRAFAEGIERDEMSAAKIGEPAPDFTAQRLDGKPFTLSSVLGKQPIVIYFAAFDQ